MYLSEEQQNTYEENGFLVLDNLFEQEQIKAITDQLSTIDWENKPGTVLEDNQKAVRAIHKDPTNIGLLEKISKHALIVEPAMQVLGSPVYIHQLKVNFKAAFSGDIWPWHQDYIYWQQEDGMPTPQAINVAIFLEEVHEFNGPLCLIPGSQKEGVISSLSPTEQDSTNPEYPEWISSFQSNLKYTAPEETVAKLVEEFGMVAPKGKPGTVLFFHPNCVHGSANNISPSSRKIAIITYNSIDNIPVAVENPRPNFLVGRDYTAIKPLPDPTLIL